MSYALKPAVILILLTKPGNVLSSKRSNMHGKAPEPGQICFFASFFSSKERRPLVIKKSDSRHPDRRRCPHQLPELYFFPSRGTNVPGDKAMHASPIPTPRKTSSRFSLFRNLFPEHCTFPSRGTNVPRTRRCTHRQYQFPEKQTPVSVSSETCSQSTALFRPGERTFPGTRRCTHRQYQFPENKLPFQPLPKSFPRALHFPVPGNERSQGQGDARIAVTGRYKPSATR